MPTGASGKPRAWCGWSSDSQFHAFDNMDGDFTWVDLSTFDVAAAKKFYGAVLHWSFEEDDSGYVNCSASKDACSGLYEMPEFFQKIKMPSFWMTYISVSDLDGIVAKVENLGGKLELEETNALGKVALIRDPSGAGFTCYEGAAPGADRNNPQHGQWCWSELFVSDLSMVERFYSELFGWEFVADGDTSDRFAICRADSVRIGAVQVADNEIKGEKEFWGVSFAVQNAKAALEKIRSAGGTVISEHTNTNGTHHLAHDSQGAAFFVTECETGRDTGVESTLTKEPSSVSGNLKWRSLVGLVVVYFAIIFEADWLWGALFLIWVIPDLKSGTTYFMERITRRDNPILYWAIMITWLVLSVYILIMAIG